jgi:hypothetical protein
MLVETIEKLLKEGYSLNKISRETGKSLGSIIYWVRKHNLRVNFKNFKQGGRNVRVKDYGVPRICPRCNLNKEATDFYDSKGIKNAGTYCKQCMNEHTMERVRNMKQKWVEYKGGKCQLCGYSKCPGALEFHHLDPSKKDFNLSRYRVRAFNEQIRQEIDKCLMVCANCHREIHAGLVDIEKFITNV